VHPPRKGNIIGGGGENIRGGRGRGGFVIEGDSLNKGVGERVEERVQERHRNQRVGEGFGLTGGLGRIRAQKCAVGKGGAQLAIRGGSSCTLERGKVTFMCQDGGGEGSQTQECSRSGGRPTERGLERGKLNNRKKGMIQLRDWVKRKQRRSIPSSLCVILLVSVAWGVE